MSVDDILFAPIYTWKTICRDIENWFSSRYESPRSNRLLYDVNRKRPDGALTLIEFAESYHLTNKCWFWRFEYRKAIPSPAWLISPFQFDGKIGLPTDTIPYPYFGEVGCDFLRSIEDVNLIPNTYTNYFIFKTEIEAKHGLLFLGVP